MNTTLAAPAVSALNIEPVWSGHSVGCALLTHGDQQLVAYYDADRQMSVAQRTLGESKWKITKLDSRVGWDSHNYVTMALDRSGFLHVSGNMHVTPLIYFRSTKPLDASTLVRVPAMTGKHEGHCTYPHFFNAPDGALVFCYRDGRSGLGDTYYNVYNEKAHAWSPLVDTPIFDGLNKMNSYPVGPELGPDGYYHMTWVWRNHSFVETNHDLSYARSRNLRDWESADGKPVTLPFTINTPGVIVDPIPVNGGIVNGSGTIGFDLQKRLVIAYHKFDEKGNTQLYFARFENGAWKHYQATDWDYRWAPQGGGSIVRGVRHGALEIHGGRLVISIQHEKYGSGNWEVDPVTMRLKGKVPSDAQPLPAEFNHVQSTFPEMEIRWASDLAPESASGPHYRLRWEALPNNRDQPRPKPWPEPSMLQLLTLP
jgi:hypothetical protein